MSPAEIESKLLQVVAPGLALFRSRSRSPVRGSVTCYGCKLLFRTFYSNSFQRMLVLSFHERDGGTRLEGRFCLNRGVMIFMGFWFGFVVVSCIVSTCLLIRGSMPQDSGLLSLIPYVMVVFGAGLVWGGIWLSKLTEGRTLLFLKEQIGASSANDAITSLMRS